MDARFTPLMFLEYYVSSRGLRIADLGVAPITVVSWGLGVVRSLAETTGAALSTHWMYGDRNPLYAGEYQGRRVSFAHLPVGAPGTVMMLEEIIAAGARLILGLGWAGSLDPEAPIGTAIIPTRCVRDEGTSGHYLDRELVPVPSPRLAAALLQAAEAEGITVTTGATWSTDAPYRETVEKITAHGRDGVRSVDMETSAMYALGQVRAAEVCNLLVISDELWHEWRPAFGTPELQDATRRAQRVILRCVAQLPATPS